MHIAFKFHYIHNNGLFIRLLNRMVELSTLPLYLNNEGMDYTECLSIDGVNVVMGAITLGNE